jgi:signal transduction histidine kinase
VIDVESVELAALARSCWDHVETDGATLVVETTRTVRADPTRLRQLLTNLFRNSVEHGSTTHRSHARDDSVEHGSTNSRLEADDSVEHGSTDDRTAEPPGDSVERAGGAVTVTLGDLENGFYVADDGPGIPAAERERVFERGYSRKTDGTGFGLDIVRDVAASHGWQVTVTDGTAGGARFEFSDVTVV